MSQTLHENRAGKPASHTDNSNAVAQVWGDYSGDGALDLAIGYDAGRVRLFRSNGDGSFAEDPEIIFQVNTWNRNPVSGLHFADFNGDAAG